MIQPNVVAEEATRGGIGRKAGSLYLWGVPQTTGPGSGLILLRHPPQGLITRKGVFAMAVDTKVEWSVNGHTLSGTVVTVVGNNGLALVHLDGPAGGDVLVPTEVLRAA